VFCLKFKDQTMRRSFLQKQIPTLLGITLLVVGLVVGVLFIGSGGSLNFAPRAAPQTTPKSVKTTNVTDSGFTVSFMTDEVSSGFVKYGTDPNTLNKQASDDRDQLTGSVGQYTTHHITLRNLQPNTQYYYTLGTVSVPKFDNNGSPFTTKTGPKLGNTPAAKTAYGTVAGEGVDGVIIYLQPVGAGPLSALVKNSGSWAVPLSTARTENGAQYATIDATTDVSITVQGKQVSNVMKMSAKVSELQPFPPITLTAGTTTNATTSTTATDTAADTTTANSSSDAMDAKNSGIVDKSTLPPSSVSASPEAINTATIGTAQPLTDTSSSMGIVPEVATQNPVVNVKDQENSIINDTQPTITGTAPANATVSITIHSNEEIKTTTKADSSGNYSIDLASLGKNLEPGDHTVTVTYKNAQGKTVTETKKFTVEAPAVAAATSSNSTSSLNSSATSDSTLLALASSSPQPFGTSNPFTIPSPTATATATILPSPTPSPVASPWATRAAPTCSRSAKSAEPAPPGA
jgi:hypothetical protein